jgi:uncharacterized iron-regulated membrane protein
MMKRILFVLAAAALGFAALYYRGVNAHEAQTRADAIVDQDLAGQDTTASVAAIKDYVKTHTGAAASFTLTGAYDRDEAAYKASNAGSQTQIYADAQKACAGKSDSITQAKCNAEYLQNHLSTAPTGSPQPEPQISKYVYNLHSPLWTPDLPGALMLGAVLALLFGLGGLFARRRH